MIAKDLVKFGLTEKEASVYLALLELDTASVGRIAKKSGVKRTTLYDIISSLQKQNLVGTSRRGAKTLYFAEDPRKFEDMLEEKEHVLHKMLPELLSITNSLERKPKIRYYEGSEGIKQVYKDTLAYPDQELLEWVPEEIFGSFDIDFLNTFYVPKRLEKKIWVRSIAPNLPEMQEFQSSDSQSLRKTVLIDQHAFPFDVEINLYGKRNVGIMSFHEEFGLIIESERLFRTLKSIFELEWRILTEPHGL